MPNSLLPIIAIEVTSNQASIAWANEDTQDTISFSNSRHIETQLANHIKTALEALQQAPSIILMGLGPGSYSSCRAAIASAICLGLWHECPVIGLPSTVATQANDTPESILIGNARRGQYFSWAMNQGAFEQEPQFYTEQELSSFLQTYQKPIYSFDSTHGFLSSQTEKISHITPQAQQLINYWQQLEPSQQAYFTEQAQHNALEPVYLRSAQITPAKK